MRTTRFKNLQQVENYYNFLLNKTWEVKGNLINLKDRGYTFQWDNAKVRFGQCDYSIKKITISKPIALLNLDNGSELKKVFLHELAHAIQNGLFNKKGHDRQWKVILLYIGGDGKTKYSSVEVNQPKGKYTLTCPSCGYVIQKHKLPRTKKSCAKCDTKFNPDKIFIVTKN